MYRFLLLTAFAFGFLDLSAQNFLKSFTAAYDITAVGDKAFFVANDGVHGSELWVTDGTPGGTVMVKDINPGFSGSEPTYLTSHNGSLYFVATNLQYGAELWKSDGTSGGTVIVKDIRAGSGNGSSPGALTVFDNELYFDASPDGFNRSLYKSDGTDPGTTEVRDMGFGNITDTEVSGTYLFFVFGNGSLWRTDGTLGGTVNINVDSYFYIKRLTNAGGQLFFTTAITEDSDIRIYGMTGTNSPVLLREFNAAASSTNEVDNFTVVGTKLFFSVRKDLNQQQDVDELWSSDGTVVGTSMVRSFSWDTFSAQSWMKNFVAFNDQLYFQNGSAMDYALWKSDGTDGGTLKISDVRIGFPLIGSNPPVVLGSYIYFSGDGELWRSDGTTAGTQQYFDINQNLVSTPRDLEVVSGQLYFIANDGYGIALWNDSPAPEIDVLPQSQSSVLSGNSVLFDLILADDCAVKTFEILNVGKKELVVTGIHAEGKDFYLEGQIPEVIKPGERVSFKVIFFPQSPGERSGAIVIRNNDSNEGEYVIQLRGSALPNTANAFCDAYDQTVLKKILVASAGQKSIAVSNNSVVEGAALGTIIGTLSAPNTPGSFTYTLVSGEGDADNASFQIVGNSLRTNAVFNYQAKNVYTIRVNAESGGNILNEQLTIHITRITSFVPPVEPCAPVISRLNISLLDVEYNSAGNLFAVGEAGRIMRSTDEGDTWQELNSGVTNTLSRIVFKGTVGYISGNGILLKSEDNGATWFQLSIPFDVLVSPKTLFFVNETIGFVAGFGGEILQTLDGGRTWSLKGQEPGSPEQFLIPGISSMWFWDQNNGIVCTYFSIVLKTSDGGSSWTIMNTSNIGQFIPFNNITFADANTGFLVSDEEMFKTADAGNSWTPVPNIEGEFLQELTIVNSNTLYASGGWVTGELFRSSDGGNSWDPVPVDGVNSVTGITFRTALNRVVIAGRISVDPFATEPGVVILSGTIGAETWEFKNELLSQNFYAVAFPGAATGYVFGEYDGYKTINGGVSWTRLNLNRPVYGAQFTSNLVGFIADGHHIHSTTNGGNSWNEIFSIADTGPADLSELVAVTSNVIIAYSTFGPIYRTGNGGGSWSSVYNQPFNELQQIFFPTTLVGYGVDKLGKLIKTVDGGVNWSTVYTHPSTGDSFFSMWFFDANNGLLGGQDGLLLRTQNGGASWTPANSGITGAIIRFIFRTSDNGYAFSDEGIVYVTYNGGTTWQEYGTTSFTGTTDAIHIANKIVFSGRYGVLSEIDAPQAPTRPGYISGDEVACLGDNISFTVARNPNYDYYWSMPGAKLSVNGEMTTASFSNAGQYTLSVQQYNACGTSTARTLTVNILAPPQTNIIGAEMVAFGSDEQYTIQTPEANSLYSWGVSNAVSYSGVGESIVVSWGKDNGRVSVIETNTLSGCRTKDVMNITVDPSTIVGISDNNRIEAGVRVYPNPTDNELFVHSNLTSSMEMRVYDMMGREYDQRILHPMDMATINLKAFPKGLYLLEIASPDGKSKAVKKIIKQ